VKRVDSSESTISNNSDVNLDGAKDDSEQDRGGRDEESDIDAEDLDSASNERPIPLDEDFIHSYEEPAQDPDAVVPMDLSEPTLPPKDLDPSAMEVSDTTLTPKDLGPSAMNDSDAILSPNDISAAAMELPDPILPPNNLSAPSVEPPPAKKRKLSPVQGFDSLPADQ
jgi:hypothetical protein